MWCTAALGSMPGAPASAARQYLWAVDSGIADCAAAGSMKAYRMASPGNAQAARLAFYRGIWLLQRGPAIQFLQLETRWVISASWSSLG
jgi:hypothetical protein